MIKYAISVLLIFILSISFSQNEIGNTYDEIKVKYQASKFKLMESKGADMIDKITVQLENVEVIFLFDIWSKKCNAQMVYPNDETQLYQIIEKYNENFLAKSNELWIRYFEGRYQEIHLEYSEQDKKYYFVWRIPQKITNNN